MLYMTGMLFSWLMFCSQIRFTVLQVRKMCPNRSRLGVLLSIILQNVHLLLMVASIAFNLALIASVLLRSRKRKFLKSLSKMENVHNVKHFFKKGVSGGLVFVRLQKVVVILIFEILVGVLYEPSRIFLIFLEPLRMLIKRSCMVFGMFAGAGSFSKLFLVRIKHEYSVHHLFQFKIMPILPNSCMGLKAPFVKHLSKVSFLMAITLLL